MLTEEESARIRAEEIIKLKARDEFDTNRPRPPAADRWWAFLNSSFAIWFLSSVILAGLGALFAAHQAHEAQKTHREETVRRLDTEISNRIEMAVAGVRVDIGRIEGGARFDEQDTYNSYVHYLDNSFIKDPTSTSDVSIYSEYRNRGFRSLIFELSTLVDTSERTELRRALQGYEKLSDLASVPSESSGTSHDNPLKATTESSTILQQEIIRNRWKPKM